MSARPAMRLCVVISLLFSPLQAFAQPLADRLPQDTLVYFGWRGADALGPGFAGSHLKAVLEASDFSQFINEFIPQVMRRIGQAEPQAGEILPIVGAIHKAMWQHPSAFYFGGLDFPAQGDPMPRIAVLCDAGPDAPKLVATLKDLIAKAEGAPVPLAVKESNGLVVLTIGKMTPAFDGLTSGAGDSQGPPLAKDKRFTGALAQVNKEPVIAAYINFEGIWAQVDQGMQAQAPPDVKQRWAQVREALGLASLKQAMLTGGFDGKDWAEAAFISAPAPRTGLMKGIEATPLSADILKAAPKTSTYVAAGKFSLAAFVAQIRTMIAQIEPQAGQTVDGVMKQASQMLGMDIEKDLLGTLGEEWVLYTDPATGGSGLVGTVLVNRLADPAKAEQSFTKFEQFINMMIAANLREEKVTIAFQTRKVGDLTLHFLAVPLVTPTWAVKDGNLYVAFYPQAVSAAADFVASKGPSILENEEFVAVRKRLGGENASGVSFLDLVKATPNNYGGWVAVSRIIGFGDLFGVPSPVLMLPPLNKLMSNLGPSASVEWTDAAGWHMKTVCPFPGSEILATDPMSAYMTSAAPAAMMVSILLPSLSRARETANRVKSASNLRQLGQASLLYANENNGKLAPDLGTLLKTQDVTIDVFISPLGGGQRPDTSHMTPDQLAAWVNEHSDYVYLGAGKKNTMGADQPLAYEKLQNGHGQGANVLFGDGHVEWVSQAQAQQLINGR